MQKTLYIHIGLPKTGTTGLQYFLHQNRRNLKASGVYYPATMRKPLPTATQHRYINEFMRLREAHDKEALKGVPHPIKLLAQEVENQGAKTSFISEELFSYQPRVAAKFLAGYKANFDCKIVMFVRRQDIWVETMYAQSARGGYRGSFEDFIAVQSTRERIDYSEFIEVWAKHFGAENIIVIPYLERQTKTPVAVLEMLELDVADFDVAVEQNPSLSGEAILFIKALNGLERKNYPMLNRMFGEKLRELTKGPSLRLFSVEQRDKFMEKYDAINRECKLKYGIVSPHDGIFEWDQTSSAKVGEPTPKISSARVRDILQSLLSGHGHPIEDIVRINDDEEAIAEAIKSLNEVCSSSTLPT